MVRLIKCIIFSDKRNINLSQKKNISKLVREGERKTKKEIFYFMEKRRVRKRAGEYIEITEIHREARKNQIQKQNM